MSETPKSRPVHCHCGRLHQTDLDDERAVVPCQPCQTAADKAVRNAEPVATVDLHAPMSQAE